MTKLHTYAARTTYARTMRALARDVGYDPYNSALTAYCAALWAAAVAG